MQSVQEAETSAVDARKQNKMIFHAPDSRAVIFIGARSASVRGSGDFPTPDEEKPKRDGFVTQRQLVGRSAQKKGLHPTAHPLIPNEVLE